MFKDMAEAPFHLRVAAVERLARENPARYRRRLSALVTLGAAIYLVLLLIALAVVGATLIPMSMGRSFSVAPLLVGGVALWALGSALFVRDERIGFEVAVGREDAPALWARIEALSARLGAPQVDVVTLNLEFNASIASRARYLLWGRRRTELRLGLPLVLMSHDEGLAAILAHEIGHHREGHGARAIRIFRTAIALQIAAEKLAERGGIAAVAIRPIARWYVPAVRLLALPERREHERAADRAAVAAGLAEPLVSGLVRGSFLGPWYVGAFLPHRPRFASLREGMERALDPERLAHALERDLAAPPDPGDEHPSLAERLALLGRPARSGEAETVAALVAETATVRSPRAWDALFSPEFRTGFVRATDALFALVSPAPEGAEAPPTPLEAARTLAATGDESGARAAFRAVGLDPASGPIIRLEASRALLTSDPESAEAMEIRSTLSADPFVGLDVLLDTLRIYDGLYESGGAGVTRAMVEDVGRRVQAEHVKRREFVAALHKRPGSTGLRPAECPRDVHATLVAGAKEIPGVRRLWTFWSAPDSSGGEAWPLLIVDAGFEIGAFKITRDDPKATIDATELAFSGPLAVAVLIGRGAKELAALVADVPPVWSCYPVASPASPPVVAVATAT